MNINFENIESANPFRNLLFRRGFFAGDCEVKVHPNWKVWNNARLTISYDPDVPFSAEQSEENFVAVLGRYVSLAHTTTDHSELTRILLEALEESHVKFLEELDHHCGRYICFYSQAGRTYALNDATGMRTVYHTTGPTPALASHAALLAMVCDRQRSREVAAFLEEAKPSKRNMAFMPGFCTGYEGVRILVPNNRIDLTSGSLSRYFPRAELPHLSFDDVVDRASKYARDIVEKFARTTQLAVSLTAGLDSRLTLAATKSLPTRPSCFTYVREKERINVIDAIIAARICQRHGFPHSSFFFNGEKPHPNQSQGVFEDFKAIIRLNAEMEHIYGLAYSYLETFPAEYLHLRSNIGETCRAYFHLPITKKITEAEAEESEKHAALYRYMSRSTTSEFASNEFRRYISETDYEVAIRFGYDLEALHYWECRLPAWHGTLLLESDMSHDTVSLYNCRALLIAFLSAPFDDQLSQKAMHGVIRALWPDLLQEPINPASSYVQKHCDSLMKVGAAPVY